MVPGRAIRGYRSDTVRKRSQTEYDWEEENLLSTFALVLAMARVLLLAALGAAEPVHIAVKDHRRRFHLSRATPAHGRRCRRRSRSRGNPNERSGCHIDIQSRRGRDHGRERYMASRRRRGILSRSGEGAYRQARGGRLRFRCRRPPRRRECKGGRPSCCSSFISMK